jgi:Xaa-Pro aminopeptidase
MMKSELKSDKELDIISRGIFGINEETEQSKKITRSKNVVRVFQIARSLKNLLSEEDIHEIRRSLAIADAQSLDLFEGMLTWIKEIQKVVEQILKSYGADESQIY